RAGYAWRVCMAGSSRRGFRLLSFLLLLVCLIVSVDSAHAIRLDTPQTGTQAVSLPGSAVASIRHVGFFADIPEIDAFSIDFALETDLDGLAAGARFDYTITITNNGSFRFVHYRI